MSNVRYTPLRTVVSMFLDTHQKSMSDFDRAWVMAFRALTVLNYSISALPKTIRIPVSGNKTVNLPPDYISWTKIGVLNNAGEVCSIKVNNALSTFKDTNPNRISQLTADVNDAVPAIVGVPYFLNYYQNGLYYNLFGVGGGLIQYGECRVDERNNVIILSEDFPYTSVILEYLSGPEQDEDYTIETPLVEAVIAFIEWKFKLGAEQSFYARAIEGRRSLPGKRVTIQTVNQVIRESTGFKLKA